VSRVPPHASGGPAPPAAEELEQLEELGDDAIIAQQSAAHAPKPRVQVTEDARSIVISEAPPDPSKPGGKRKERSEKTLVIRDRRQLDELHLEMARRKARGKKTKNRGLLVWVGVGVAAFVTGALVAVFATRSDEQPEPPTLPPLAVSPLPSARPVVSAEPPSVSVDELPVEGSRNQP